MDRDDSQESVGVGLHGSSGPGFDPSQYYLWKDGQMHNSLVVVSFNLVDHAPGDGGFAVVSPLRFGREKSFGSGRKLSLGPQVPGSHKSNLRGPDDLYTYSAEDPDAFSEGCKRPTTATVPAFA